MMVTGEAGRRPGFARKRMQAFAAQIVPFLRIRSLSQVIDKKEKWDARRSNQTASANKVVILQLLNFRSVNSAVSLAVSFITHRRHYARCIDLSGQHVRTEGRGRLTRICDPQKHDRNCCKTSLPFQTANMATRFRP